jgi:hypothetical protein
MGNSALAEFALIVHTTCFLSLVVEKSFTDFGSSSYTSDNFWF